MSKSTIFVAIENKQVLSKIKILLERDGYATEGTDDGLVALNTVRLTRPSLVILGDTLFRMDGFKVCRFLKFDDQYKHIPIILLVSEQHQSDQLLSNEVGAEVCLVEPFHTDNLMQEILKLTQTDPLTP